MKKRKLKVTQLGKKRVLFHDLYYKVLKASWSNFLFFSGLFYLVLNFVFALFYFYSSAEILNARADSLWDAFIFSFQTSSTLGYGHMIPQTDMAHFIVLFDTMLGIFYVAIITGLAFSKFSRPSAKIMFSNQILLTTFDGIPTLTFRMGNNRETNIIDAKLNVAALLPYTSSEGHKMRRFYKLPLISNENPTFSLSWTAMHPIDKESPLYDLKFKDFKKQKLIIFISFTGIDDILSQTIHSNHRYTGEDMLEAKSFVDILSVESEYAYTIDFRKFHDVVPLEN